MKIRAGYEISYDCPQPTPMILALSVHPSRVPDLLTPDRMRLDPPLHATEYRDGFGNICHVIRAPTGRLTISSDILIQDSGEPDAMVPEAAQSSLETLPVDVLVYLLGSRYCETDRLISFAWSRFGKVRKGWPLVQAICDYVHHHITFGYEYARCTKTAFEAFNERTGVCRDYTHLAVALCRCMNIPARYCTGYLADIGIPPPYSAMDFAAWMEVYLGGRWYTFDPRNNVPRIGRVLIARGRDAADVAITTTFGPNTLESFTVVAEEVGENVRLLTLHPENGL